LTGFRDHCTDGLTRIRELIGELKSADSPSLAALMVAVQAISDQCKGWATGS
jgi:hypothetical protein